MDQEKTLWTALVLLVMGAFMGLGKLLVSNEELTWRLMIGRSILGAFTSMIAGVALMQFPDLPPLALLGIGSVLGMVGAQFIEATLRRRWRQLLGGRN